MSPIEIVLHQKLSEFLKDKHGIFHAGEIEGLVVESFQTEPWFDEVSYSLAMYAPRRGSCYLDVADLAKILTRLQDWLEADDRTDKRYDFWSD